MKRIISYAAVAIALCSALVSCEKFTGAGKTIGFKVKSATQQTKTSPITTDKLRTDYGEFYSQAKVTGGNDYYAQSVTSYAAGVWATGQSWPEDGNVALDFWSYGPVAAFAGVTPTFAVDNSTMSFDFAPAATATEQKDVIVASTPNRKYDFSNPLVPVDFKHALAAVRFQVKTLDSNLAAADKVEITSITLSGVKSQGTCTVNQSSECSWTLGSATTSYSQAYETGYLVENEYLDAKSTDKTVFGEEIFMLLPQTFNGAEAAIKWTMDGVAYDDRTAAINNVTLEAGIIYTFTININARAKSISLELTDWIPWEKVDNIIDFDNNVVAAKKTLSFTDCVIDEASQQVTFQEGNTPITCSFKIDSPLGATFMVSFEKDFDAFEVSYPYSRVIVADEAYECIFQVTPTVHNPTRDYVTTLKISARTADGRVINVDDVVQPDKYTIVLPKSL